MARAIRAHLEEQLNLRVKIEALEMENGMRERPIPSAGSPEAEERADVVTAAVVA